MDPGELIVDALEQEDFLLRRLVAEFPRALRDLPGPRDRISCKQTLGHLAYWDDFAVRFFERKLDLAARTPPPPDDFEKDDSSVRERVQGLPFGEVLGRYLEATGALADFLRRHWTDLSERERQDFWIPLRHRRQHRLALARTLQALKEDRSGPGLAAEA